MAKTVPLGPLPTKAGWVALITSPLNEGLSKVTVPETVAAPASLATGVREKPLTGFSAAAAGLLPEVRKSCDWPKVMSGTGLSLEVVVMAEAVPRLPPCTKILIIVVWASYFKKLTKSLVRAVAKDKAQLPLVLAKADKA